MEKPYQVVSHCFPGDDHDDLDVMAASGLVAGAWLGLGPATATFKEPSTYCVQCPPHLQSSFAMWGSVVPGLPVGTHTGANCHSMDYIDGKYHRDAHPRARDHVLMSP